MSTGAKSVAVLSTGPASWRHEKRPTAHGLVMKLRSRSPAQPEADPIRHRLAALLAEAAPRRARESPDSRPPPDRDGVTTTPDTPAEDVDSIEVDGPAGTQSMVERLRLVTRRHAAAVAIVAGLAVLLTFVWVLRARPVAAAVPIETLTPTATPVTATPGTPSPPALITVHIAGAVANPGVVHVPSTARVADGIAAAGGLRADADAAELNLAAPLVDGCQVIVGTKAQPRGEVRAGTAGPPAAGGTSSVAGAAKIDLNTATEQQLDGLPGVGPVTAKAILDYRAKHGRFARVEQLQEVDGIGPKTYAQIAAYVRV